MSLAPGTRLGSYEITGTIGAGGMGEVYRAFDARLQRHVAIKTLAAHKASDPHFRTRFEREARAVAALSHPNVLAIHDVGNEGGVAYMAVELLEGETLRQRLATSPLRVSQVLDYALQIGRGLAAAHERGIVHRDLKPENIFVTRDGHIKLLDFGIATEPAGRHGDDVTRAAVTEAGLSLGTVGYVSPEQARGERVDARTDIFSFGCVVYEMLSGRRAFAAGNRVETLHAVLTTHPPDLVRLRADVPPQLDRVVCRCLEKRPEDRFQTTQDLVFALEALANEPASLALAGSPRQGQRARGTWAIAAIVLIGVVAAAALSWGFFRHRTGGEPVTNAAPAADSSRLVAVLPFTNISADRQGYFAAGMTEEVTNQLSKLSGLRVVARTATAGFKDARADLPRMVQELGIGSVVTGTVREDGSRVRVNVELIDARSGQLIWSEQYDREGVDVFAAQSDIALHVAEALNASVTLDERARVGTRPTSSVAAYELYVRARDQKDNLKAKTKEERLAAAIALLQQAVQLDPQFAEAYSEIANACYFQAVYGDLSAIARGLAAARKAIDIDPQLAPAYRALALNLQQLGRLHEALSAYHKAIDLDASYAEGLTDASYGEITAGHYDEALKYATRARALTSRLSFGSYHVGVALLGLDDDVRTERYLTDSVLNYPNVMRLQVLLAFLDLRRGQAQAAVDRMRAAGTKAPDDIEVLLTRAEILTFAGAPDAPAMVRALMPRAADGLFHNAPYPVKLAHAYHLQRAGAAAEAAAIMDAILDANRRARLAGADWPMASMQDAAVHALRGELRLALDDLDRAYAAGWRDGRTLAIDPLFASVRSEPRFQQLLSRIEHDVAAMRARADYSRLE